MKKAVFLFGPHAVGKMTIGQELERRTDLRLFHNHMSIEPLLDIFRDMPEQRAELTDIIRKYVFREYAKSNRDGLIFTFIWYFDDDSHKREIQALRRMFKRHDIEVCLVELEANKEVRLARNCTENRLAHKPSKRDLTLSKRLIDEKETKHRVNSYAGEVKLKPYLKINNTELTPEQTAERIIAFFEL